MVVNDVHIGGVLLVRVDEMMSRYSQFPAENGLILPDIFRFVVAEIAEVERGKIFPCTYSTFSCRGEGEQSRERVKEVVGYQFRIGSLFSVFSLLL